MRYLNLKAEFRLELVLYIQSKQNNKDAFLWLKHSQISGSSDPWIALGWC